MEKKAGGTGNKGQRLFSAYKRKIGIALAALTLVAGFAGPVRTIGNLPGSISITQGDQARLGLSGAYVAAADGGCIAVTGVSESVERVGVLISGRSAGTARLTLRFMGIVPVKTMSVSVREEKMLIPGGSLIGVAIQTQGVLLVGTSDVGTQRSPARAAGLRSGDSILAVNGQSVTDAQDLSQKVASAQGARIVLTVERDGSRLEKAVQPVMDARDGAYRLGAWVRDSTAGVGTLSFIDPETGLYGALGHSISDIDTQTRMLLAEGEIYDGAVADIRRGEEGAPGELVGSFFDETQSIGTIETNTDFGIYGRYTGGISGQSVPIMTRTQVQEGPAVLIAQVDNAAPREYACEITRVNVQDAPSQRGLVIRVTDPELLAKTGGIVQGMSGSPILQDGKLVGAVTHVCVNQ